MQIVVLNNSITTLNNNCLKLAFFRSLSMATLLTEKESGPKCHHGQGPSTAT